MASRQRRRAEQRKGQQPNDGLGSKLKRVWDEHGRILRAWLAFLGLLGLFHALLEVVGRPFWNAVESATAQATGAALSLLGAQVTVAGNVVHSDIFPITVIRECTGVHPALIYAAAVVALPVSWRAKAIGVALGLPALALINQVRLVSLVYIGKWFPAQFDTAHMLVWQSLMLFFTLLLWIGWAARFGKIDAPARA